MERDYSLKQLAEIAFIAGELSGRKIIDLMVDDLEEAFEIYAGILEEWSGGIEKGIFKNVEEVGYIGAYAQRVLFERYKITD